MTVLQAELAIGPEIGHGQYGRVCKATCPVHGEVAAKIYRQRDAEPKEEWEARRAALLREGKHLAEANHENIVRVFYVGESPDKEAIHLVMEYCDGGSLQGVFEKGPLPLNETLRVAHSACLGLEALHARGKLHRDIKPGNILRMKRGDKIKIGDFGLVTDEIILGYAKNAGYKDHIAYEMWHGTGASVKSDIWALGMTIYRLLHGQDWYLRSEKPRKSIEKGGYAKSLIWLPHIPDAWRRFVRKTMNDDAKQRYQSANQVLSALAKLPSQPEFNCTIEPNVISWRRNAHSRIVKIEWEKQENSQYGWRAWSEPRGKTSGNNYTLGSSDGAVSYAESLKQLELFFERQ